MELLERGSFLEALDGYLTESTGAGIVVLIGGEAGIGKTALIAEFAARQSKEVRLLWGACDAQFTPRALGPLLDIADQVGGSLGELARSEGPRDAIFAGLLQELHRSPRPNLVVVEDIHWADDATLDFLRFVARRLGGTRTLLLVTYRSDEIRAALQVVLGDLARLSQSRRIDVPALSEAAVTALAKQHHVDAAAVYRTTAGNPFFVSEVLASGGARIPPSVRDAVMSRAAGLSAPARAVVDAAALIGARVGVLLLERVEAPQPGALEECLEHGVLERGDGEVLFRHELARQTIAEGIGPTRAIELHRRILDAMTAAAAGTYDPARLAHHAEAVGDRALVLEHAGAAARRAAAVDAHREAAAQYARVLRFAGGLPAADRAPLYRAHSYECYVIGDHAAALSSARQSLESVREAGDGPAEGDATRWLSRILYLVGRPAEADAFGRKAVELLEVFSPGHDLAMAYSNLAQLRMNAWQREDAEYWGRKAIDLARRIGDTETLVHSLNNVGTMLLLRGVEEGRGLLDESIRLGREGGLHEDVARALSNLVEAETIHRQLRSAERYADQGLALAAERELGEHRMFLRAWRSNVWAFQGLWPEAVVEATDIATNSTTRDYVKAIAETVLGRIDARRGGDEHQERLDVALRLAEPHAELQFLVPIRIVRAEAAWLAGDMPRVATEVEAVFDRARELAGAWYVGELALWRWKASGAPPPSDGVAEPFALHMAGENRAATERWDALGCPYEAALALSDASDEASLRESLARFERLGARPAAALVARRLRAMGARAVARGPIASTRANAANLTRRELEVLELLATGLRNADIAQRLFVSPKTVDHHVSAVLAKLGAATRGEAARLAHDQGLLSEPTER
jgi:DNA-binding CsgD family transcriptional regulator/tetratricopeptide (TPR) repeat protein